MIPEYIDREAANLALAEQGFDWDKVKQALASVPAADVAPVVHGEWIKRGYVCGDYEWECSACHETEWRGLSGADVMKFCMFCGARMDGGADDA